MQRYSQLQQWKQFFEYQLKASITIVEPDSEEYNTLKSFGVVNDHLNGCIHNYQKVIVVRHDTEQALKTLIHESCHVLYYKGLLTKANKWYLPSWKWLKNYPPSERAEESIVESTARWAVDFEADGSINQYFKNWLRSVLF